MDIKLGGRMGFWLLNALAKKPGQNSRPSRKQVEAESISGATKLERFFGKDVWKVFTGKSVLDYGCGAGTEAVAVALHGARKVHGIDILENSLCKARALAATRGLDKTCVFLNGTTQRAEVEALRERMECVYSLDSFEHYARPEEILRQMYDLLAPGGRLLISFGPPWKHPFGCHMWFFNRLPWMHFLFKEETIMAVRSLYRSDGAKRFEEAEGGLNQMTVARFLRLVENSGFRIESLRPVPIRGLTWLVKRPRLREYFTSVVQCVAVRPAPNSSPGRG